MSKSLAVKYRPDSLNRVIGQEQAKAILETELAKAHKTNIPPAALLITGDTGLGNIPDSCF